MIPGDSMPAERGLISPSRGGGTSGTTPTSAINNGSSQRQASGLAEKRISVYANMAQNLATGAGVEEKKKATPVVTEQQTQVLTPSIKKVTLSIQSG